MEMTKRKFAIKHTLLPALLLVVGVYILYPYCQYYIDPDAIAYIAVAKHYAAGDMAKAVNGYWSPWSCWLTAWLIRTNVEPFASAIIVNTIGASGFLISCQGLFSRFVKSGNVLGALSITLSLFLIYAVYQQSFADLWYCFFLMLLTLLITGNDFAHRVWKWPLAGLLCCLAYFAKAYALPFGLLAISVVTLFQLRIKQRFFLWKWLKMEAVVIVTTIIVASPWLWALHDKYGMITTGTAGALNLSWYLVGHPIFKEGIDLLLPPVYAHGIYYWEDPWWVNGALPHFYSSPAMCIRQMAKVVQNALKFVISMNELSAFMLPSCLFAIIYCCSKKIRNEFPSGLMPLVLVFLLFPAAYFLINFEARYLWFMLPFAVLFSALLFEKFYVFIEHKMYSRFVLLFFLLSFLAYPFWDMQHIFRGGKEEYEIAGQMKQANIKGSFASNIAYGKDMQHVVRLAYFLNESYYYMPLAPKDNAQLISELTRYNVRYFIYYNQGYDDGFEMKGLHGRQLPLVFEDARHTVKVFDLALLAAAER